MKIAVLGAGAMGSVMGGLLAKAGNEVTLIGVWREAIDRINQIGRETKGLPQKFKAFPNESLPANS